MRSGIFGCDREESNDRAYCKKFHTLLKRTNEVGPFYF